MEYLFWCGRLSAAIRVGFERRYDLTERVLPPAVLARPTSEPIKAWRELMLASTAALGVGTEQNLRDDSRPRPEQTPLALAELVATGELLAGPGAGLVCGRRIYIQGRACRALPTPVPC